MRGAGTHVSALRMPESSVAPDANSRGRSLATVGLGLALLAATFLAY